MELLIGLGIAFGISLLAKITCVVADKILTVRDTKRQVKQLIEGTRYRSGSWKDW